MGSDILMCIISVFHRTSNIFVEIQNTIYTVLGSFSLGKIETNIFR